MNILNEKSNINPIEIAKRLPFGKNLDYSRVDSLLVEVMKMLNKMLSSLRS